MEKKIKILTIDGSVYLGELKKDKDTISAVNAIAFGSISSITKEHLIAYVEAETLGTLQKPITIGGSGVSYSESDLSDDLELELGILYLQLKKAENNAPKKLVAGEFKALVKGS
jgi:hypothetical protein